MCRQTMAVLLHMCSGFPTKVMEQMILTSLHDVTRFSRATEGGKYKGEHNRARGIQLLLLLSSGCFNTSVRVFTKPQTLYLSCLCAPRVGIISWISHKHVSRPIWRTLSYCDFIYLMATRETTTSSP